ncbi:hypothetical protein QTI33_26520 [Variovorax sp. J22P271]|uniref:hypothetical protein n=1 Tax=Variovorax davisae TaxID=3053515 RepID=UPI002576C30A|nr:hypothetical protein [Variovorax sp. J22P271]MDM0035715.1 hypothetical protein [Variovorax sp. J22P271]
MRLDSFQIQQLSNFVEPTEANNPSTVETLPWKMLGWYSLCASASSGPQSAT